MEAVKTLKSKAKNKSPRREKKMSLKKFLNWKSQDGFVYEWANGQIIPKNAMQNYERIMIVNIQDKFSATKTYQAGGRLIPETDCKLSDTQVRRPDMAFFTQDQIIASAKGEHPIPSFVVEIISKNDKINEVEEKRLEYFKAGVQVIWYIFPDLKLVRIFISPKQSLDCIEQDICNAKPAVLDLEISADAIFEVD